MITCLGLIVGIVDSCNRVDILRKCAEHVLKYHLSKGVFFEIDGEIYAYLADTHTWSDGCFGCYFNVTNDFGEVIVLDAL